MGRRRAVSEPQPRQLWLTPAPGDAQTQPVARVVVRGPVYRPLSYRIPPEWQALVRTGSNVRVPCGRGQRTVEGLCVGVDQRPWDQTLPPVLAAANGPAWLSPSLVELGLWLSAYYVAPPWKAFTLLVPAATRKPRLRRVVLYRLGAAGAERWPSAKGRLALEALAGGPLTLPEIRARCGAGPAAVRSLMTAGRVERLEERVAAAPRRTADWRVASPPGGSAEDAYALTAGQAAAVERITTVLDAPPEMRVFLLFGVPGSGKTEVYVRAIRAALARGKQAIVLVPEIALATQVSQRLARRFERVATLHSRLTSATRRDALEAIAAGEVDVVIGARAATFAPCPRLGLIVVDEEQEGSFKHLAAPYFHARDAAVKRAQIERIPVLLGSATPALETWHNAVHRSHYELLRLPERVPGARLPQTRSVTLAGAGGTGPAELLSPQLVCEIERTLAAGGQVVLLHNRRGFATALRCERCGLAVRCPRCRTQAVYHRAERVLKCHRCGVRIEHARTCSDSTCGGVLRLEGAGIQRLEQELGARCPQARVLRVDSDTMLVRGDYGETLRRFESGEADILLGTQMVAKGLDFPNVRLVGVVDADAALSLPDFRAPERVLQLVVQVVGRAGRRAGDSLAVVQTSAPPPSAIRHALALDYAAFAAAELAVRAQRGYPPFTRLVRIVCSDATPARARAAAARLCAALRTRAAALDAELRIDDPAACVVARQHDRLRWEVLVRGPRPASLNRLLSDAAAAGELRRGAERIAVDVDPLDFL